jgi:hypothetical protein
MVYFFLGSTNCLSEPPAQTDLHLIVLASRTGCEGSFRECVEGLLKSDSLNGISPSCTFDAMGLHPIHWCFA